MGYLEDLHHQIIGEDHISLLKHIAVLPGELKYIIWKLIPLNIKMWVTKRTYIENHTIMMPYFLNESFMLRIIGADCHFPFFNYFDNFLILNFVKNKKKKFFFNKKQKKNNIFHKKVIYKDEIYHNIFHLYFTHAKRSNAIGCLEIFNDYGYYENSFKQIKTLSTWTN
jgi:hypothetical protein